MKGRPWSDIEVDLLLAMSQRASLNMISLRLNRSNSAVQAKAADIGLQLLVNIEPIKKIKGRSAWTKEEIFFLTENINQISIREICTILRRSESSVKGKIRKLKLKQTIEP